MKRYIYKLKKGIFHGLGFAIGLGTVALLGVSVGTIHTFSNGTTVSSEKINENFANLKKAIETLDTETKTGIAAIVPVGTILPYGGNTAPEGYLLCNGMAVSRTSYPALFSAIGTAFGSTDGSSFHLPDLRGRFLRGLDGSAGVDPDRSDSVDNGADGKRYSLYPNGNKGNLMGSYQEDGFKSHNHDLNLTGLNIAGVGFNGGGASNPLENGPFTPKLQVLPKGGNETRPKNMYVNFIIKY